MKVRRFHFYAKREDLQAILEGIQIFSPKEPATGSFFGCLATEIATMHYDNKTAKELFDGLKKSCAGSL